ncbi:required for meiotic nuclear division protein 1 homolog [Pocillopora damicornis]|uniref:required for meiotic nuclear division protein 1 homolog n=1 Tax=Pocillopora damicornis TaxID=46731 RepID=UPI000F558627|nr:required for meiotic nuclear division protein 1 homolog [Pocillopora damicornis]XP_058960837.1 required for meiotic nuclear division protein 1 homolog [Pocillopora verrucosa]
MANKLLRKCVILAGFCVKNPPQKSSNFFSNRNLKVFKTSLYHTSSIHCKGAEMQKETPGTDKIRPRTKSPSHKMRARQKETDQHGWMICQAYVTGERYNIHGINSYLGNMAKYQATFIPEDEPNVLRVCIKDKNGENSGEVFFFGWLGSLVLWNVCSAEEQFFKKIAQLFQDGGLDIALTDTEDEQLLFSYSKNSTALHSGRIILNENSTEDIMALEKYTFSNALALSVKLAIWESVLDQYVESIQWVPEDLRKGRKVRMSRKEVLEKTGELISLRYKINLSSDLLMTPDFYWDRENLENLYDKTCVYLDIHRRTRVMNEKLNHCSEMVELLRTHLSEKHSFRLEWGIIALIAVEVVFETLYLIERYFPFR